MKKLLIMLIVLSACVACFSSCELINSIFPCKHKEIVTDAAVAPTCTETGLTEGSHCVKCGEVVVAQQTVPAAGHKEVLKEAVAPTCTEDGLSAGVHCSVCNATLIAQESVPAGHTFTDWKTVTEPDCFFPGEETRICKVCDLVENRDIEPIAHSFVQDEETKLFSCELCDAVIYAGHLYAAIDKVHTWYDAYVLCNKIGGHLATITSNAEQNIITNIMEKSNFPVYWIGGFKNTNGWEWVTGEEFIYTNWIPRMPDNKNGREWYINIYSDVASEQTGGWNDLDAAHSNHRDASYNSNTGFVCEWELDIVESEHYFTEWEVTTETTCFGDGEEWRICTHCGLEETRVIKQLEHNFIFNEATGVTACEHCNAALYNGHIYKIFEVKLSWFDAYTYCNDLGGHLVTITSQEEQTFIETYMNSEAFNLEVWIGAYTDGTGYQWVTGEDFEYTNWDKNQPDNYGGEEFFVHFNFGYKLGLWNDYNPFHSNIVGFICEWEAE